MFKMRGWSHFLIVGALLASGPAVRAQEETEPAGLSLDEEYALLAEAVPGFGGLYLDAEGTTHVYLQDLSRADEVRDLGERVEVHQGDYDFRDLLAWKGAVRDLLAQRGVVFLDVDEQRNRLLFGVERESLGAFTAGLPIFLRRARVPIEAVLVEAAEPIVTQEQLTDTIRPVPGGVRIRRTQNGSIFGCTLGVNANRASVRGFITNSHCTAARSIVDGTVMFQATVVPQNQIGVETVDPPFFVAGSCPSGKRCRRSDAAFFAYDDEELSGGGQLANSLFCGLGAGPGILDVNPSQPRRPVSGFLFSSPAAGSLVMKVGATTGCTFGAHKNTCLDVNVSQPIPGFPGLYELTNITMLCQNRVSATSDQGDSGSPVFIKKGDKAILVGILWGGPPAGSYFTYSPWLYVFSELGAPFLEMN